jgi:hypothetical protein
LKRRALDSELGLLRYGADEYLSSPLAALAALLRAPVRHNAIKNVSRLHGALGKFGELVPNLAQTAQIHHSFTDKRFTLRVSLLVLQLPSSLLPLLIHLSLCGRRLLACRRAQFNIAFLKQSIPQRYLFVDGSFCFGARALGRNDL